MFIIIILRESRSGRPKVRSNTNDSYLGSLERKHPRRNDVRLLRRAPVHRIPKHNPSSRGITLPITSVRRILRRRRSSGWNGNSNNLPARSPPYTLRCTRPRTNLQVASCLDTRDSTTRRRSRVLSWELSSHHTDSSVHGTILLRVRRVQADNG